MTTPQQWQEIDRVFAAALEREPAARAAFLDEACAGNELLRKEVESLLANDIPDSLIGDHAVQEATRLLEKRAGEITPDRIGRYRIIRSLGVGGMGRVYLGLDEQLNRQVAVKLLSNYEASEAERMRRFRQEALAASALNHPNILTIYEIGEFEGTNFIIAEFVDGVTLRARIKADVLPLDLALDTAIQIASALSTAHAARIIHRDIKPENVMMRADGLVKVLDFGIAKFPPAEDNENKDLLDTMPGRIIGTVAYMSPEQARGALIDGRSDIWSLGVILYEMVARRLPFWGNTPADVIAAVLERQPPPLPTHNSAAVQSLEQIVFKALQKERESRYQTAAELMADLKEFKQRLEIASEQERSDSAQSPAVSQAGTPVLPARPQTASALPERKSEAGRTNLSGAEYVIDGIKHNKLMVLVVAVGLVLAAAALTRYMPARNTEVAAPFQTIELNSLTNTGRVKDAVISLDGKYVAYVAEDGGKDSIWLKQVTTSSNVEIVPPAETQLYGATFSNDSTYLYYLVRERNNSISVLYRVPVLGGTSTKLIVDVDGPISLSPDGKQLTFVRGSSAGERALMLANADGSEGRKLASRTERDAFAFGGPAWSPDGKSIVCGAGNNDETGRYMSVVTVQVADGSLKPLTTRKWRRIGRVAWLRDGTGLILIATDYGLRSPSQLWYLSYPDGKARRITKDLQDYDGVSLTSDSTVLVSKQTQTISGVWNAPNNDADRAKQILSNKYDGDGYGVYSSFSWTSDGKIMYTSLIHGTSSIWVTTAQGNEKKQLTPDSRSDNFPSATSDARYVVFVSDRSGFANVWRMDTDGNNEKQLTNGSDDSWALCSPDGQWVIYHSWVFGKRILRRVSINGGDSKQLTDYPSACPVVSPNGRWISCYYRLETKAPWKLAIIPFDGGPPVKTFDVPKDVDFQSLVRWTPDGRALAYITNRDGISNIWIQPLDGSPSKQATDFKSDQIFWFDWSRDGRQLGVSRGAVTSDVVLIKDLR